MSIISEALKKAQEKDEDHSPRNAFFSRIKEQRRNSGRSTFGGVIPIFLVIGLAGLISGSFYFILFEGVDAANLVFSDATKFSLEAIPDDESDELIAFGEDEEEEDDLGIARYSIEERPFHQVAGFTAKSSDPLFVLSGIARSEDGYLAVINDQILAIGDSIEGAIITDITLDYVELELNKKRLVLEKSL